MPDPLGALGFVVVLAALILLVLAGRSAGLPRPRSSGSLEPGFHEAQRQHFLREHPDVIERHFAERPETLTDDCPHHPAHRELVTAAVGPMGSVEVVAYICRLCGHEEYVEGSDG